LAPPPAEPGPAPKANIGVAGASEGVVDCVGVFAPELFAPKVNTLGAAPPPPPPADGAAPTAPDEPLKLKFGFELSVIGWVDPLPNPFVNVPVPEGAEPKPPNAAGVVVAVPLPFIPDGLPNMFIEGVPVVLLFDPNPNPPVDAAGWDCPNAIDIGAEVAGVEAEEPNIDGAALPLLPLLLAVLLLPKAKPNAALGGDEDIVSILFAPAAEEVPFIPDVVVEGAPLPKLPNVAAGAEDVALAAADEAGTPNEKAGVDVAGLFSPKGFEDDELVGAAVEAPLAAAGVDSAGFAPNPLPNKLGALVPLAVAPAG